MKKLVLATLAATTAFASPALAQTATGTITITGTVGDKCQVVSGAAASSTFTDSRDLLDLSQANGTLEATATLESLFGTVGAGAPTFRVVCTTAAPKVTVQANPILHNTPALRAPLNGYTGTVDYTASAKFDLVAAGTQTVTNLSTAGAASSATLTNRLAASSNNVTITTSAYNTAGGSSTLLNAGGYTGTIVVTISPI